MKQKRNLLNVEIPVLEGFNGRIATITPRQNTLVTTPALHHGMEVTDPIDEINTASQETILAVEHWGMRTRKVVQPIRETHEGVRVVQAVLPAIVPQ